MLPLLLLPSTAYAITVAFPRTAPSNAPTVSPSLFSLSIEQDRITDWLGTTSRNEFFYNTLDNLKQITGVPPHIRIGANSEDRTHFRADVEFAQTVFPPPTKVVPYPEATQIVVGDSYYQTARFLPPNTHVTWGVNFGAVTNMTAAYLQTRSIMKAFASGAIKGAGIVLDYLEIGNEADLYGNNGLRAKGYTSAQYVNEWVAFAKNVSAAAGLSATSGPKLLAGSFADQARGFTPQGIFDLGVLSSPVGKYITTFSQHRYSGSFCAGNNALLQDLMTKSTIRTNVTVFSPSIAAVRAKGLEYILGETNSFSCHGAPGVSNNAGAALWTLDYALYATQAGVSRVFFHQGIGFKYNLIQPVTLTRSTLDARPLNPPLAPHVQPQYYAAILAAEALRGGNVRVSEIPVNNARIAAYGFYEDNTLVRAIVINSLAYLRTDTARPAIHIDVDVSGDEAGELMSVKRLVIPHADDGKGLSFGGQTYETVDGRPSGALSVEVRAVSAGFDISATEAVLLEFLPE